MTKGCPYVVMWHVADGRYPQWLFLVTNDALESLPSVKHYLCALNTHLSVRSVAESLPSEGWSHVGFPVVWEGKERACLALGLEAFAEHVKHRQGVSEVFWRILAPVIGGSLHNFRYLSEKANDPEVPNVATPKNQKIVTRKGHGKSPRPTTSSLIDQMQEEKLPDPPQEPVAPKTVKRRKEMPPPEAFKHDQPLVRLPTTPYIRRSREWFRIEHPFFHMERKHDPFPAERVLLKSGKEAGVEEEKAKKPRAQPIKAGEEGSTTRVDCGLNNLYDTECKGRVGRCTYYQDYDRKPASVVKTSWYCRECKVGLHQECYYDYHRVVHGIILADEFELNKVRRSRKCRKRVPNGSSRITYKRHSLDLQDGYSCDSQGSQEGRLAVGEMKPPAPDQEQFMHQSNTSESDETENN